MPKIKEEVALPSVAELNRPFRTPFTPRVRVVAHMTPGKASKTRQADKESCDINFIVKRFQATGMFPHVNQMSAAFGDVSELGDYQSLLQRMDEAQAAFDALPAVVRKRFGNDPAKLLEFVADPANVEEAVKLGLMEVRKVETTGGVQPVVDGQPKESDTAPK